MSLTIQDMRAYIKRCRYGDIKYNTACEYDTHIVINVGYHYVTRYGCNGESDVIKTNAFDLTAMRLIFIDGDEIVTPVSAVIQIYDHLPEQEGENDGEGVARSLRISMESRRQ